MFEFLFNYPLDYYQRGTLVLRWSWPVLVLAASLAALTALFLAGYLRPGFSGRGRAVALGALRAAWVAPLTVLLFAPALVVGVAQSQRGDIAVLLDDSQSMRIGPANATRADTLNALFAPGKGTVAEVLAGRFALQFARYSQSAAALDETQALRFDGARSNPAAALRLARTGLANGNIAAAVLVTDGGNGDAAALRRELLAWRSAGLPVYTVGLGERRFARDLELVSVALPTQVLAGDRIEPRIVVQQRGLAGSEARLQVTSGGLLVHQESITVPAAERFAVTTQPLSLTDTGLQDLQFTLVPRGAETLTRNNHRAYTIPVAGRAARLLHFEGEPRFEIKFARRAVHDDHSLKLVSLVRTAENKYYRVGVDDPQDLVDGFPRDAATLFGYDAVILGSVESTLLEPDQQALLRDFVSRRGGSLLLLGGRHSFAEGGYAGSPLAALLPVDLEAADSAFRASVMLVPTTAGNRHPIVQALLRTRNGGNLTALPPLTMVNPLRNAKPGATVLLRGEGSDARALVVLAYHRYGKGTVAVLSPRDTWRWQMHQSVPLEDLSHETLWRQTLRWLVRPVRGRIRLAVEPARPVRGEQATIRAEVLSPEYLPLAQARVAAVITDPLGNQHRTTLRPATGAPGVFTAAYPVSSQGSHEVSVTLNDSSDPVTASSSFGADASGNEYYAAEMNEPLLRQIAHDTGGAFFTAANAGGLVDAIRARDASTRVQQRLGLHDAPAFYLLIVLLLALEWFLRRRWRLA